MTCTAKTLLVCVGFIYFASCGVKGQTVDQTTLDHIAQTLQVAWTVVTNTREIERYNATLTLSNAGLETLDYGEWTIYFYSLYPLEPDRLSRDAAMELTDQGVEVMQVNGMLFKLSPTVRFRPLPPGGVRVLRFHMKFWSVAFSDVFPNWYMTGSAGTEARIIANTEGDDPTFVTPFYDLQQQKRFDYDLYPARTAQERYHRNYVPYSPPDGELRIVPKPLRLDLMNGSDVTLSSAWKIFDGSPGQVLGNEVSFLVGKLSDYSVGSVTGQRPTSNVIILNIGNLIVSNNDVIYKNSDAYIITVDDVNNVINVTGREPSGVFRGLQTLLSLLHEDGTIPKVEVHDAPRFSFRGLFLDISRNFRSREEIERLLGVMAMYKLNKLHLHLSDDEGWRIEIHGLPELTQIGAKRCHDPEENECLLPQLGSGPFSNTSGSGYLTAGDYQSILRTAKGLHIEVIPEIDVPGHARAAIKAMERRYRYYMAQNNSVEAERYRLIDPDDPSVYTSPQFFNDNVISVCRESAYAFLTKVVQEIKKLHENIQPLHEFHMGFDEVGGGVNPWLNSTICYQFLQNNGFAIEGLNQYFFMRMANITHAEGLALGGWEDGLMLEGNQPFDRSLAPNSEVYANVWNNVWEWGTSSRTYTLANMDYKVVMSHATSLYFDHPQEPHWEERGYYWAPRYIDTQKTFGFMPTDYYANIDERRSGQPISREEVCGENDVNCPALTKPENIIGMQGHLWGETVRTSDQVDSQLFPRVLALAERAWHQADWETEDDVTARHQLKMADWYSFARTLGYRELPRLDRMGIKFRIPPPGAVVQRQKLRVATGYPGLEVEMSKDGGSNWQTVDGTEQIMESDRVWLRSRTAEGRYSRTVDLLPVAPPPATSQTLLDYMSDNLSVHFELVDNYLTYGIDSYVAALILNNTGDKPITAGNWELQFPSVQWLEVEKLLEEREFILQDHEMALSHVQGYLFRLSPLSDFPALENGTSRKITFRGQYWSVSKYEQFPNYFVVAEGANPRVIKNTAGESMSFVEDFNKVNQWKRDSTDLFDPLTPSARYGKQADVQNHGSAAQPYLPTPQDFEMDRSKSVSFAMGWVIVASAGWTDMANFLKDQFNGTAQLSVQSTAPASRYIELRQSSDGVPQSPYPGAYTLTIDPQQDTIVIVANDTTGALYGVQSLVNMALQSQDGATVFKISARDAPRFGFRGMYLDVSRNFHSKESVLKLLRVMSLYKLNRFHLHLADDEGWRLEIPGLPELTTVGSHRCYDATEEQCLVPVLGSGPDPDNPGSGFFTVQDYQEILSYAAQRHIQVIPEFDMPGHSRAAIKAMALRRRRKLEAGDVTGAHEYELDELGDTSVYSSVQLFSDNAVNPCMDSTYRFIRHVIQETKKMHDGINPLHTYHFGGDEVASGAWMHSKACSQYVEDNVDLKFMFSTRVAAVAAELGMDLAAWEDGIIDMGTPIPREDMAPNQVYANAWQNIWEWGSAARAYLLANAGYKVIMSQATHLYFDHPYEPSPDERGLYWATRYTDSRKTFHFQPDDLWSNVDIDRFGHPLTLHDVCGEDNSGCPPLTLRDNVVGMQGHLWSETVRRPEQVEYMVFPRLLALAERAWHKAPWEGQGGGADKEELQDWTSFANSLGYGQLSVLDRLNVSYRVCPPGVRQQGHKLHVNTEFPGLKTQYRMSDSDSWRDVADDGIHVRDDDVVNVRTLSTVVLVTCLTLVPLTLASCGHLTSPYSCLRNCFEDPCAPPDLPCQNGGVCTALVRGSSVSYKCDCPSGTTGKNCETTLDMMKEACSCDRDCGRADNVVCFKNQCLCKPGYYLSESRQNGTCLETCPPMMLATTFSDYPKSSIAGYNLVVLPNIVSRQDCLQKCLQRGTECRTFDWSESLSSCALQGATAITAESAWNPASPDWTYHQRDCY